MRETAIAVPEKKTRGVPEVISGLRELYRALPPKRRRNFHLTLVLMLLGALAELMTIGAVIPFLTLLSDPEGVGGLPIFAGIADALGVEPANLPVVAALTLVTAAVVAAALRLLLTHMSYSLVFRIGHDLSKMVYERMLKQPYAYFVQRNTSEVLAGVEKIDIIIMGVLLPLMQGFTSSVMAIAIIVVLFLIDPLVATVAAAVMSLVYITVGLAWRRRLAENSLVMADRRTARVKQVQEGLGGIREIIIDQSQPVFARKFTQIDHELRDAQAVNAFIAASPRFIVEATGIVLIVGLAYLLSLQPGGLVVAIPVLGALALGAQRLLPMLQLAYVGWSHFIGYRDNLADVIALMRAPVSTAAARLRSQPVEPFRRDIAVREVSFRYADGHLAVQNVDFRIRKGERVGFVGRTGSGKSTLVDLIMGLLDPLEGRIEIDGASLADSNRADWQAQIAHVPQTIYLTDSSIASNIAFGLEPEEIDLELVVQAARRAKIHEFICTLPDGYRSEVGERGIRLSGGQRQRIGIARALYKRANVLVLDEATSALDHETETSVMSSISELGADITVLMIAHRLSSVANCDRILRLAAGKITADGTFEQVLGRRVLDN